MKTSIVAVFVLASAAATSGQQPVFRAAAELVHLDVSVLDKDRRPVRGLTAGDFVVLERHAAAHCRVLLSRGA